MGDLDPYEIRRRGKEMAGDWRCLQCNEVFNPSETLNSKFRWAGDHWQHHHKDPIGHIKMVCVTEDRQPTGAEHLRVNKYVHDAICDEFKQTISRLEEKLGTMHADFYTMQDGSLVRDLRFVVETKQKTIARLKVRCKHLDDNLEEARDGLYDDRDELKRKCRQQEQTIAGLRTELSELTTWVNDAIAESNRKAKEETQ